MTIDAIVTGHLCIDLIPPMDNVPVSGLSKPGHMFEVGPLGLATGGCVSNVGQDLYRLGVDVRLMGVVGDDPLGGLIIDLLNRRDPSLTQYIRVQPGQSSSYTVVLAPERKDRIFLHYAGQNATFDCSHVDFGLMRDARIMHMGYPPIMPGVTDNDGAELAALFERSKAAGIVASLDMTLPDPGGPSGRVNWRRVLERSLPHVDVFVPSIAEILFMLRRADFDAWRDDILAHLTRDYLVALADEMIGMGVVIAGFKLGEMGMFLRGAGPERFDRLARLNLDRDAWAGSAVWQPAFQANVVNTLGAGDAAYAGLIAALLQGSGPDEAARWANAVGACNVEAPDATSGVRSRAETQARLDASWPHRPERLRGV
ncbi:MAG: carbohydrate kinase family protein [Anaerolineae bacterium]|nr:carbohydrate kinase family protein [Anaerolineae bacterium]